MVPSQKQLQWAELRVGLTVIFALIVLAVIISLMTGTSGFFTKKLTIYTYVDDASGLRAGSPVRLQDVAVGSVVSLQIVPERQRTPVQIKMKVAGKATDFLKKDSVVMLTTVGALGETYVNIDSTAATQGPAKDGDTLPWRDVPDLQDMVRSSQTTLQNADALVRRVDRIVSAIEDRQGAVGQLIYDKALYDNLNRSVIQAQQILNEINSGKGSLGLLLRSDDLYNKLNASVDKVNQVADEIQAGQGSIGKLLKDPALYDNANQAVRKANKFLEDLNSGKGALGKFAHDQEFANKLQNVVNRLSDITDRLDRGEGSAGKLLRDSSLYDNTNKLLTDTQALMQAIRQNPKKYLTIQLKLF
jgi:phospholipid/cholesterol/gamma-HCH transport system substrate-binding protein